jgi:GT2 family glycosyltransferase
LRFIFVAEGSTEVLDYVEGLAKEQRIRSTCTMNFGERGLAQARNLGVELNTADYIAFVDDDVVLPAHWAESVISRLKDSDVIGVTGPAFPLWENGTIDWLPREFYWLISCSEWFDVSHLVEVRSAQGMNMAFRREAFDTAGRFLSASGYHKPIAEDLEFSLRVTRLTGKKIVCDPTAFVYHTVRSYRFDWRYIVARSYHIGMSRYVTRRITERGLNRERELAFRLFRHTHFQKLRRPRDIMNVVFLFPVVFLSLLFGYLDACLVSRSQIGSLLNQIRSAYPDQRTLAP